MNINLTTGVTVNTELDKVGVVNGAFEPNAVCVAAFAGEAPTVETDKSMFKMERGNAISNTVYGRSLSTYTEAETNDDDVYGIYTFGSSTLFMEQMYIAGVYRILVQQSLAQEIGFSFGCDIVLEIEATEQFPELVGGSKFNAPSSFAFVLKDGALRIAQDKLICVSKEDAQLVRVFKDVFKVRGIMLASSPNVEEMVRVFNRAKKQFFL